MSEFPTLPDISVQQRYLEQLRYGIRERVGAQVLHDMKLEVMRDVLDGMVYGLSTKLLAEKLDGERHERKVSWTAKFHVADGPWQRWKERNASRWWGFWVKWRPVRYLYEEQRHETALVVEVTDYATFPHNDYVPPDRFGPVVYQRMTREW